MRINQNIPAMNAHSNMYRVDSNLRTSIERLSSGLRINSAADDAGGLAISESLRAQVRGIAQAEKNAQDGIAVVNTAESVLDTVHEMLQRMRELAVQASNGTITDNQRATMQSEVTQLCNEIDRLGTATDFNGVTLFTAGGLLTLQVGPDNDPSGDNRIELTLEALAAGNIGNPAVNVAAEDISTIGGAQIAIDAFNNAITSLSQSRATLGAQANRLEYTVTNLQSARENIAAAESRIRDADMAVEMTNLTRNQILLQSSTAMLAQANQRPQSILALFQ